MFFRVPSPLIRRRRALIPCRVKITAFAADYFAANTRRRLRCENANPADPPKPSGLARTRHKSDEKSFIDCAGSKGKLTDPEIQQGLYNSVAENYYDGVILSLVKNIVRRTLGLAPACSRRSCRHGGQRDGVQHRFHLRPLSGLRRAKATNIIS
jgi:hypothetical protein